MLVVPYVIVEMLHFGGVHVNVLVWASTAPVVESSALPPVGAAMLVGFELLAIVQFVPTRLALPVKSSPIFVVSSASRQPLPAVCCKCVVLFIETTARATRIGQGNDLTPPFPSGSIDAFVVNHCAAFCVTSATMHREPCGQLTAYEYSSPPQLTPYRH